MRQRQGGLIRGGGGGGGGNASPYEVQAFESRESGAGGATAGGSRAAAPGYREGAAAGGGGMASYSRGGLAGGTARAVADARTSIRATAGGTSSSGGKMPTESNSVGSTTRRSTSSVAVGGNNSRSSSTNNQAEDIMSSGNTPRRLSSSSARAASCPSGSPYLEPGFQQRAGGRIHRRAEYIEHNNTDLAYGSRRSSGVGGAGGRSGRHRDGYHHHHHHEGGRGAVGSGGARTRAAHPSTAPSTSGATELDRRLLPSIDGLDTHSAAESCPGGGGGRVGCRGDKECFVSSASSSSSQSALMRRDTDPPGSNGESAGLKNSLAAAEQRLPDQGLVPGKESVAGHLTNNNEDDDDDDDTDNGGRGEANLNEHNTCVGGTSGPSGDTRLPDHTGGYNNSGGRTAPSGDSNSGGEVVASSARRIGSSGSSDGGGGSLRNNGEVVGRNSSSGNGNCTTVSGKSNNTTKNKSGSARECLVGLQNLGNTCFMNACLQCLLHTDALVDLFRSRRGQHERRLSSHNNKSPTRGALAEAFRDLVALVEASPAHSNVSPAQVQTTIHRGTCVTPIST